LKRKPGDVIKLGIHGKIQNTSEIGYFHFIYFFFQYMGGGEEGEWRMIVGVLPFASNWLKDLMGLEREGG